MHNWETVIGLEIHVQLKTLSKLFSSTPNHFGALPNQQVSLIELGFPGTLPVLNQQAVYLAILFGLAVNGNIASTTTFARKSYFYPDLPKGYQISQFDQPIVSGGQITISMPKGEKTIPLVRAHLEEDAGKLVHEEFDDASGVDLNRAGTPLIEIVSTPTLSSPEEAVVYMKKVHQIVTYLEICDGNMQEGSLRCDANISIKPRSSETLGTRTEIKNINSFRYTESALHYEIARHTKLLEQGESIKQETRLFDPQSGKTLPMREKADAHDYRYFPDPDLPPLEIEPHWIKTIAQKMPELAEQRQKRYKEHYAFPKETTEYLTQEKACSDYFDQLVAAGVKPKVALDWISGEVAAWKNRTQIDFSDITLSVKHLAELIQYVEDEKITLKIAKHVFTKMWQSGKSAQDIITDENLESISDPTTLEKIVEKIVTDNPNQVKQYRAGNQKIISFFVGQAMKASQGKADPKKINQLLLEKLKK